MGPGEVLYSPHHHALLTQVVLPTVPGLILVGEAAVKRGSLVILDFGLDVFCHLADSWRQRERVLTEILGELSLGMSTHPGPRGAPDTEDGLDMIKLPHPPSQCTRTDVKDRANHKSKCGNHSKVCLEEGWSTP